VAFAKCDLWVYRPATRPALDIIHVQVEGY
jgi:hypothetical protein